LSNDTILLTGCSSGFGRDTSLYLARRGFRVVATMRDTEKRGSLERLAAAAGVSLEIEQLDVTDASSIARCVDAVLLRHGRIDGLVNNAGFGVAGAFHDLSLDDLRAQLETNFFGAAALTRAVLPQMIERRQGRIVNISSIGGYFAVPFLSAYHASKFALEGLSESMRHELLPFGVFVCLIEPGTFRTPIFDTNRRNASGSDDPSSPFRATMARAESRQQRLLRLAPTDTRRVSRAIHSALTERSPRLRRFVGIDARLQRLAKRLLPFRVLEVGISVLTR